MPIASDTDLPLSFHPNYLQIISAFIRSLPISALSVVNPGNNGGDTRLGEAMETTTVAQALEAARDSPEGAQDPTVIGILEIAVGRDLE